MNEDLTTYLGGFIVDSSDFEIIIKEFASQAQFMVISHREENIVNADRIYGVSMQQSGITDIFSVNLQEEAKRILELEDIVPEVEEN